MSDGLDLITGSPSGPGRRRAPMPAGKPWARRIIVLIVLLAVLVGLFYVGKEVKDRFFTSAADYSGQGTGSVTVEIPTGANGQQIANILKKADVIKSAQAFYQLSLNDSRFQAIHRGGRDG